jgi:hypothetical protein
MKSYLPIIIFIALALVSIIGLAIVESSATAAVVETGNTSKEEVPLTMYTAESAYIYVFAALLMIIAAYFAVKMIL